MNIRGKLNIEPEDVLFYNCVASVAFDSSKRNSEEATPTFIIEEAISYFSKLEKYEVCKSIKDFYDSNPSFFVDISRAEWFGMLRKKD